MKKLKSWFVGLFQKPSPQSEVRPVNEILMVVDHNVVYYHVNLGDMRQEAIDRFLAASSICLQPESLDKVLDTILDLALRQNNLNLVAEIHKAKLLLKANAPIIQKSGPVVSPLMVFGRDKNGRRIQ